MHSGALSHGRDVTGTCWDRRREDGVDHMDDTVACGHVSECYICAFDGNRAFRDSEGRLVSVVHGDGLPVGHIGRCNCCTFVDVIEEDVGEGLNFFLSVEVGNDDACCLECRIGWGEHRERALALEGTDEVRLRQGFYEGVVNPCCLSVCGYVLCLISRCIERHCGHYQAGKYECSKCSLHDQLPASAGYKGLLISMLKTGSDTHQHQQIFAKAGCILPLDLNVQAHRF